MGLKQDIIVVNNFSVPLGNGKGTRGGTPGEYVLRYMSREQATEPIAPIKVSPLEDYKERFSVREDAVETVRLPDRKLVKSKMAAGRREGGVSFGYGSFSLSDEQLIAASADIQNLFDNGHTVMKTVLSFSNDYLRQHGIITETFSPQRKGDYRGNIDQLKLRLAIMRGLDRMGASGFDDLRYVGTIQVDTLHVHCHLAMVDAGRGQITQDGTQRGKLDRRKISLLRRGIDAYLDDKQTVKHLSSAVDYERRNVISYIKRWAHSQILRESLPQLLIASLPEDRRRWRFNSNDMQMRRPNALVRELVEEILERPGSPMRVAMASVVEYANYRRDLEGLSASAWAQLVDTGKERIIERGVNAVYAALRNVPKDVLKVRTPILDVMSMDYSQLAAMARDDDKDDLVGFGYRLRSYSSRMHEHDERRVAAREEMTRWEESNAAGLASPESRALYRWWALEEDYHARLAAKYRHFLPPVAVSGQWAAELKIVEDYWQRFESLQAMVADTSLARMKNPDDAEAMGLLVYGQKGGRLLASKDPNSKDRLAARVEAMQAQRDAKVAKLRAQLARAGKALEFQRNHIEIVDGEEFDFDQVKGLDLHHMSFDFSRDVKVGKVARREFLGMSLRRTDALISAVEYLESTGQGEFATDVFDIDDVMAMNKLAKTLQLQDENNTILESRVAKLAAAQKYTRSATFELGSDLPQETIAVVEKEIENFEPSQIEGKHFGESV